MYAIQIWRNSAHLLILRASVINQSHFFFLNLRNSPNSSIHYSNFDIQTDRRTNEPKQSWALTQADSFQSRSLLWAYSQCSMPKCTKRFSDLLIYRLTDLQIYRLTDLKTYRFKDLQIYRFTDLQTYRLTDLQTQRFTDLQIYRLTDLLTYFFRFPSVFTKF